MRFFAPTEPDARSATLDRWERRTLPFVVAAAVLPMFHMFGGQPAWFEVIVLVLSWCVFAIDLGVHVRMSDGYLRTRLGVFDATIVVLTFPWALLFPGQDYLQPLVLIRLARLARVAVVALGRFPQLRLLAERLSNAAVYVGIVVVAAAAVVRRVEPASSDFNSYGDAIWWAIVTLTTVGYGDYTPVTSVGRVTGVVVMLVGVAFLGAIAASLASFFGLRGPDRGAGRATEGATDSGTASPAGQPAADRPPAPAPRQ